MEGLPPTQKLTKCLLATLKVDGRSLNHTEKGRKFYLLRRKLTEVDGKPFGRLEMNGS